MSLPNRRELLITKMQDLESRGMGCIGCAGTCCTFEANTMMLTPLEAVELMGYLKKEALLTHELKEKLEQTKTQYRLEHPLGNGRRSYLRRTYTCPFFGHTELGCPLPREVKPFGCLAFDSHHPELKASSHCYSEKGLMEERELKHPEEVELNLALREKYQLYWDKTPIPNALLDLWNYFKEV